MSHSIETYHLHAYLDGELSQDECIEVERALAKDDALRQEFESYKVVKNHLISTYSDIPKPKKKSNNRHAKPVDKVLWTIPKTMVASLFLGLLIGAGLYKTVLIQDNALPAMQLASSDNYLVHIDSDSPEKQKQAIEEIELLFESVGTNAKVDLISNYKGVSLLDVNNPNNKELSRLIEKHGNLTLYACKRALERAKQSGNPIHLMPQVKQEKPAIDAVVERLNSGWNYIKI